MPIRGMYDTWISGIDANSFLLLWLSIPSGFLVVFEKPNRSSFTLTNRTRLAVGGCPNLRIRSKPGKLTGLRPDSTPVHPKHRASWTPQLSQGISSASAVGFHWMPLGVPACSCSAHRLAKRGLGLQAPLLGQPVQPPSPTLLTSPTRTRGPCAPGFTRRPT